MASMVAHLIHKSTVRVMNSQVSGQCLYTIPRHNIALRSKQRIKRLLYVRWESFKKVKYLYYSFFTTCFCFKIHVYMIWKRKLSQVNMTLTRYK